jgi:hypothetical protein
VPPSATIILTGAPTRQLLLRCPTFRHPCRLPVREVLLLWPMCSDVQVSRFQDEKERQKSPKPFCRAVDVQGCTNAASAGMRRSGLRPYCCSNWHLLRFAILRRSQARGSPSVVNPFGGTTVHWTLVKPPPHPCAGERTPGSLPGPLTGRRFGCTHPMCRMHKCRGFMDEQERPRLDRRGAKNRNIKTNKKARG